MISRAVKLLALICLMVVLVYVWRSPSRTKGLWVSWVSYQPRHVHLSLGNEEGSGSSLIVTWVTLDPTPNATLLLVKGNSTTEHNGNSSVFVDGGEERRKLWIHKVELDGLEENSKYKYVVGSSRGWSNVFHTTTPPARNQGPLRIALYGDLGNVNAFSLSLLQRRVQQGFFHTILHLGDLAYDFYVDNGRVGDAFMEQIEPLASAVPYMTCPGNHEHHLNFSHYKARFNMPGDDSNNMFYSFNLATVHFVSINTEFYYFYQVGLNQYNQVEAQYNWLVEDLARANSPEARAVRPWVILFGHRPMYSSSREYQERATNNSRTRLGIQTDYEKLSWGLEDLLDRYSVDLALWAHEHNYERLWPTYNITVYNGTQAPDAPYTDPGAPVHITTGPPGNAEKHDPFLPEGGAGPWSAFRSSDYGFTEMTVANGSHINIRQISTSQAGNKVDDVWIVKNKHGPYPHRRKHPDT